MSVDLLIAAWPGRFTSQPSGLASGTHDLRDQAVSYLSLVVMAVLLCDGQGTGLAGRNLAEYSRRT